MCVAECEDETTSPDVPLFCLVSKQAIDTVRHARCRVGLKQNFIHHPPRVSQVRYRLRHEDWSANAAFCAVYAELQKDVVEHALHDVPIADDAGERLEGVADLAAGRGVRVGVVADIGARFVVFAVAVAGDEGREEKAGPFIERPACFNGA